MQIVIKNRILARSSNDADKSAVRPQCDIIAL